MSTHLLGNVQLVTKQEVEAMLGAVVVPEASVDSKVEEARKAADARAEAIEAKLAAEGTARELADKDLLSKLKDESVLRDEAFDTTQKHLDEETDRRRQAIGALIEDIKKERADREDGDEELGKKVEALDDTETEELSNLKCYRLKNLPVAVVQVDNDDKSLKVGDTVATVTDRYRPAIPIDFPMTAEQVRNGRTETWLVLLRLDAAGNVNVVNMFKAADGSAATDTATVTYITRS